MTDQPTTWTPERALEMLRDWGLPTPEFCRKWPMEIDTIEVAIAALESAAAEIERLRAELAAKQPAEAEAAQQGPSDEEIVQAILDIGGNCPIEVYHAIKLLAQRAGVKL